MIDSIINGPPCEWLVSFVWQGRQFKTLRQLTQKSQGLIQYKILVMTSEFTKCIGIFYTSFKMLKVYFNYKD